MVYYEAWLRLTPELGQELGPSKSSDPFEADTPAEAVAAAFEWMERSTPENREAAELWLHEGASKTKLWSAETA